MYNIEIKILRTLRYRTILSRSTILTIHTDDTFNSLPTILVSRNDPSCVRRHQYNKVYFRELFLAAYFSRKFGKPSDIRFQQFIFFSLRHHTFRNLPSKIVLYSIYVIMYVHGNQLTRTTDDDNGRHILNLSYYLTINPTHHIYNIQLIKNVFLWNLFISKFSIAALTSVASLPKKSKRQQVSKKKQNIQILNILLGYPNIESSQPTMSTPTSQAN